MELIKLKCENCGATLEVDSAADKIVCQYCKAEILIDDEATKIKRVEEAKLKARQENHEQELKERQDIHEQEMREQKAIEEENAKKKFKKGPFGIFVIICAVFSVLLCATAFKDGKVLAGLVAIVMVGLFVWGYLMKSGTVKEPKKGLGIVTIITGIALFFACTGLYNMTDFSYNTNSSVNNDSGENKTLYESTNPTIEWDGLVMHELLPEIKDKTIEVLGNNADFGFLIHVNDVSKEYYNQYVEDCKEKGFTINKDEISDHEYEASNAEGYKLKMIFGKERKQIDMSLTKSQNTKKENEKTEAKVEEPKNEEPKKEETKPAESSSSNSAGIRKDFKEAMDSYEAFMGEYCEFMKKYTKSNGTDISLLTDYGKYVSKYSDWATKFENWKSKTNDEELKYYLQVQTRVNQKLLEVTK